MQRSTQPLDYFKFRYCPECGCTNLIHHSLFTTGKMYFAGKGARCRECGKEWHVIWENPPKPEELEEVSG